MSVFRKLYGSQGKRSPTWTVGLRLHTGETVTIVGFKDKGSTVALEAKLERLVDLRRSDAAPDAATRAWLERLPPDMRDRLAKVDLITPEQVSAIRPLADLVDSWVEHMLASETTERQATQAKGRALRVINGTKATRWSDLDPGKVEQYLRGRREAKAKSLNRRSSDFHLAALRQFCAWAVRAGHAAEDPLRVMQPLGNHESDRRRVRRALSLDELRALLLAAERGPVAWGLTGLERAMLYRLATETGLRYGELIRSTVGDFDLVDENRACVRIAAKRTKNRKVADLPLRPATAKALAAMLALRLPTARVFVVPKTIETKGGTALLGPDLEAAKIPVVDEAGRVVDFHALRTTFGTMLARSGVPLAMAQRLMRHSTPTLTSNVYTVLGKDDERGAVAMLPDTSTPAAAVAQATGTDNSHLIPHLSAPQDAPQCPTVPVGSVGASASAQAGSEPATMAEGVGFEPTGGRASAGFQNRSRRLNPRQLAPPDAPVAAFAPPLPHAEEDWHA